MTTPYRQLVDCPHCNKSHTVQSAFARWLRDNPRVKSRDGHVVSDLDYIIHRYFTPATGRMVQCIMFVEVKTHGKIPEKQDSQMRTLSIARQLYRNQHAPSTSRRIVTDGVNGPRIQVRDFGGFLLTMDGTSPLNSEDIRWHGKSVSVPVLEQILRFDLDPVTLKRIDHRLNHHHPDRTPRLL